MIALYSKYRPNKLSELAGQEFIVKTLTIALELDRVSHAYLLTGPRGCGKTSAARILAKSLNCKAGQSPDPCGQCLNCIEIAKSISPDVTELDAASNRKVDEISELIERCHLAPQTAKRKIYILDEVHMLTGHAFNALLKTIEEPPPGVVFILATTEEDKVPSTILSRCQRFTFHPIEKTLLASRLEAICKLEGFSYETTALKQIAELSRGGFRDALGLLEQVSLLGHIDDQTVQSIFGGLPEAELLGLSEAIMQGDLAMVLEQSKEALSRGLDAQAILKQLLGFAVTSAEKHIANPSLALPWIDLASKLMSNERYLKFTQDPETRLKGILLGVAGKLNAPVLTQTQIPQTNQKAPVSKASPVLTEKIQAETALVPVAPALSQQQAPIAPAEETNDEMLAEVTDWLQARGKIPLKAFLNQGQAQFSKKPESKEFTISALGNFANRLREESYFKLLKTCLAELYDANKLEIIERTAPHQESSTAEAVRAPISPKEEEEDFPRQRQETSPKPQPAPKAENSVKPAYTPNPYAKKAQKPKLSPPPLALSDDATPLMVAQRLLGGTLKGKPE